MMIIFEQNLITNHIYLVFRKEEIKIMEDTFPLGRNKKAYGFVVYNFRFCNSRNNRISTKKVDLVNG